MKILLQRKAIQETSNQTQILNSEIYTSPCSSVWTAKVWSFCIQNWLVDCLKVPLRNLDPSHREMLNNTYWWSSEPSVLSMLDALRIVISNLLGQKLEDIFPKDTFFFCPGLIWGLWQTDQIFQPSAKYCREIYRLACDRSDVSQRYHIHYTITPSILLMISVKYSM